MILAIVLLAVFCPFTYMVGRVHGVNQSVKALERYSKAAELAGGSPIAIKPKKTKSDRPKNVHGACGGQWDKWIDCQVNIVRSDGTRTGNVVLGQRRHCSECGEKEVRTDI